MNVHDRSKTMAILNVKEQLRNIELEALYHKEFNKPVAIGSLCPVTKDVDDYRLMLAHIGIPEDFIARISWLPIDHLPEFKTALGNAQKIDMASDSTYMFIKKVVNRRYYGNNPEKVTKLLEKSKVLQRSPNGKPPKNLYVIFPPSTQHVAPEMENYFLKQEAVENIYLIMNGRIIKHKVNSK